MADLDPAIAADPGFLMAYVLKALISGLSTEKPQIAHALSVLGTGKEISTSEVEHPNDAIAMFAAHQGDFLLGQSDELRDRERDEQSIGERN